MQNSHEKMLFHILSNIEFIHFDLIELAHTHVINTHKREKKVSCHGTYSNKVDHLISRYIYLMFCEYLWLCFEMFYTRRHKYWCAALIWTEHSVIIELH